MTPTQMAIELQHQQLQNGPRLDALMKEKILPSFFEQMDVLEINDSAVLSRSAKSFTVSLLGLCTNVFISGHTDAYFGPELLQVQPSIIKAFGDWEQCNWKFLFQLPDVFAKDMLRAKDTITGAFTKFYRLPRGQRPNSIFFVNGLEDMLREVGLGEEEMGKFTLLHYWAIVGNNYKLAFWLLVDLVFDPALQEQIRQEVISAVHKDTVDETHLLERCPRLESLFNEMLRLTVSSSLARVVTETTVVGGKMLKAGNRIIVIMTEIHLIYRANVHVVAYQGASLRPADLGSRFHQTPAQPIQRERKASEESFVSSMGRWSYSVSGAPVCSTLNQRVRGDIVIALRIGSRVYHFS
jgi:hypothetical protein